MELFKAHNQWKTRPMDERFTTLQDMHNACVGYQEQAVEASTSLASVRVEADNDELKLVGNTSKATLSHWAMGQLSQRAKAPANYLRSLPTTLAAQNLNHGIKAHAEDKQAQLLFHENGSLILRSLTSEDYTRIWNSDTTRGLLRLQENNPNWKNPMAYKIREAAKNGGWPELTGEMEPAGLYASDHDMFAFLVDESKTIEGSPQGLNRGFFVWNSEVGASSWGVMSFLYDRVCGNNIVWGASEVNEMRIRHVGNADERAFKQLNVELIRYCNSSASDLEAKIKAARNFELGTSKEEIFENLFGMITKSKIADLSQTRVKEAIEIAHREEERYGNPNTLWAAVSGLTQGSQSIKHTDERVKVDRAAGKLLKRIEF